MKKINWLLIIGMIIGTLYLVIFQYNSSRILTYLAVIPVLGAPILLKKTKFKLNDLELFWYYLFVLLADFLGCVVNLYNMVWWYDSFVHFLSGIFTFGLGLFLIKKMNIKVNYDWFLLFFNLCFVMFIAGIWELFEFSADNLLGMNLQHNVDTGVVDSMIDMISAFFGGIVAIIWYLIVKK